MALELGTRTALPDDQFSFNLAGMSQAIYAELDAMMAPPLQKSVDDAPDDDVRAAAQEALDGARNGWQKLAYAVASGVISHLRTNLEIRNIQTRGPVPNDITGNTATNSGHNHGAGGLALSTQNVTFNQVNEGSIIIE